jgi:PAS domain S-box-containing protein
MIPFLCSSSIDVPTATCAKRDNLNWDERTIIREMPDQHVAGERLAETVALLRESEAEFQVLAESMPQMVWMTRPDGWNTYFNRRWVDYTGLSLEESYGHGWNAPFHPDDRQRAREAWQRAITGGDYSAECRLRAADGTYRWMLVRGLPLRDGDGHTVKWIGTCTDIDEVKQAQEAALRSESVQRALAAELETERARLIAAQAVASIGSWETDLTTLGTVWSAETHHIFETDADHFHPTHAAFVQRVHPEDRVAVDNAFARTREQSSSDTIEHRIVMPDGRIKFVEERWRIVCDAQGERARAIGTCQDITERRRAHDAIRMQAQMLDQIGQAVIATDTAGRVTYANRFAGELYGWAPGDMLGRVITEVTVPQATQNQGQEIMALLQRGETWTGEFLVQSRDGRVFPAHVTDSPVLDEHGNLIGIIGISIDITARKQLEQHYLRAQRMESIGTLAGGIAHDLNNVLAPILLSIGLLNQDEHDADRLETLATIEASAKRGAAMIARLLSFARGADGICEDVQVPTLVRHLATIVRDTFPKNIAFEHHVSPELWALQADATQLHQVLLNLCVNARDAMPAGGRITLTAENIVINEAHAALNRDAQSGPYVTLIVEDTGTGIPTEIIDQIFDPFFTTKELGKGTGLGLATSLAIVAGHKGFMRVYSTLGTGTRFEVYLPAQMTRTNSSSPIATTAHRRGNGETVLVIDDEAGIRQIAKRTLEAFGYRVLLASDGSEAIALYVEHRAQIAVVITDMMMPLMDGTATIQELVRIDPQVRIVGASGLATDAHAAGAAAARVLYFLPKPFTTETLLTAIGAALDPSPA